MLTHLLKFLTVALVLVLVMGCDGTDPEPDLSTLSEYLDHTTLAIATESVIACAAGGDHALISEDPSHPTSVYFYPVPGATRFQYFETDSLVSDPLDFNQYQRKDLADLPLFNGYLRRYLTTDPGHEKWAVVTFQASDTLRVSSPIRLKRPVKPTRVDAELVRVNEMGTMPGFTWTEGPIPEDAIYFQVIADQEGNLVSGTYTFEKNFQFYDLSNVVLNIRSVDPPPVLEPDQHYQFTLMGVSRDNWVNLLAVVDFRTHGG